MVRVAQEIVHPVSSKGIPDYDLCQYGLPIREFRLDDIGTFFGADSQFGNVIRP